MVSKPKRGRRVAGGKNQGGRPPVADAGKKNQGGRPPVADADRRDTRVPVLTTASEYEELQGAAAYVGMSVSTWIRSVALERARALAAEKEAVQDRNKQ
jgi:hypothetical protein